MQQTYTLPIYFTFDQVIEFGKFTGDDGPVHSVDGVVQGGLILSMLPKWIVTVMANNNLQRMPNAVSVILESKFRNKLKSEQPATVSFEFKVGPRSSSKVNWRVFDDNLEYCSGYWIIHKS
jgi:hypothetical protein